MDSREEILSIGAEIAGEAAKGADLWSIFTLTGFTPEEARRIYQDAAEHDTPFSFPVTFKTESFTMIFRFAGLSLCWQLTPMWQLSVHYSMLSVQYPPPAPHAA